MRTTDPRLWSRTLLVALVLVAGAGCGSDSSSPSATATDSVGFTSGPDEAVSPIVGRWSQLHAFPTRCTPSAAGLGDLAALQAAAFGPDRPESEMPTPAQLRAKAATLERGGGDLCAGAHAPYVHSHFFTADGQFGSLDEHLQQVDDGGYRVAGDMLVFGKEQVPLPRDRGRHLDPRARDHAGDASAGIGAPVGLHHATWMVSVAYAGSTWHRAPCRGWC